MAVFSKPISDLTKLRLHFAAAIATVMAGAAITAASTSQMGGIAGGALSGAAFFYATQPSPTFAEHLPSTKVQWAMLAFMTGVFGGLGANKVAENIEYSRIRTLPQLDLNQTVRAGDVICMNLNRGTHALPMNGVEYQYTCP